MALPKDIQEKIDKRQISNKEIVSIIEKYVDEHPDMRFGQLLYALNVIKFDEDPFYIESVDILKRMEK